VVFVAALLVACPQIGVEAYLLTVEGTVQPVGVLFILFCIGVAAGASIWRASLRHERTISSLRREWRQKIEKR
jgi:hypothetical protein